MGECMFAYDYAVWVCDSVIKSELVPQTNYVATSVKIYVTAHQDYTIEVLSREIISKLRDTYVIIV